MSDKNFLRTTDDDFLDALDHLRGGRYEEAMPLLARVVALDPSDHDAYEMWIDAHMGLLRYRRAIQLVEDGISQGMRPASLLVWKALALSSLGELPGAERAARAALTEGPELDTAAFSLSVILEKQGRQSEALDLLRRFNDEHPGNEPVAFRIIDLAHQLDRHDLVIQSARDYVRGFGKNAAVLHTLGLAYVETQDDRRAERAFRDAIRADPDVTEYHVSLVMLMLIRGKESEVKRHFDKLGERDQELADIVADEVDRLFEEFEAGVEPEP